MFGLASKTKPEGRGGSMHALTRQIGDLARCELTYVERRPIDMDRARRQHRDYEELLHRLGAQVHSLPAEADLPDAVFVEDAAVVLDECAVLPHMGAASRRAETASLAAALAPFRRLVHLAPPGRLDGGDVLRLGRTLYVGSSSRSDAAGAKSLRAVAAPLGYDVREVPVRGCLHLKSAVTAAGPGTLLVNPARVDTAAFAGHELLAVPREEPDAANVLRVGDALVVSACFPRTLALLRARGFDVHPLDNSELLKAEAGLTCTSLLFT
jgi:dimethylargininase